MLEIEPAIDDDVADPGRQQNAKTDVFRFTANENILVSSLSFSQARCDKR